MKQHSIIYVFVFLISVSTKNTVFNRIGNSDVKPAPVNAHSSKKIYSRLGAKAESNNERVVSQIPIQEDALKYEGILKSPPPIKIVTVTTGQNNVRKIAMTHSKPVATSRPVAVRTNKIRISGTMRADETPISAKEKLAIPKSKSVQFSNKVEFKEIEKTKIIMNPGAQIFNKPERRLSMPEQSASDVKSRLGLKNQLEIKTKSVFNRLGV